MKCIIGLALLAYPISVVAAGGLDVTGQPYHTKPWDAKFTVDLDGTVGGQQESFTIRVHPEWAPLGAQRFQDIVGTPAVMKEARFFRVVKDFMVQFGIPGNPTVAAEWESKDIQDDPLKATNKRGRVTFAMAGKNTRTTQMFINFADNTFLDSQGFPPFAEVLADGMNVVDRIQNKYGESPDQNQIQTQGNEYLKAKFPGLSFITDVETVVTV